MGSIYLKGRDKVDILTYRLREIVKGCNPSIAAFL